MNWPGAQLRSRPAERKVESSLAVPYELSAAELVARFIYSERRINKRLAKPTPDAFYPPPDNELSVVHSTGLPDRDVWAIGRMHTLGTQSGRDAIHGRADVPVNALIERRLRAIRDDNPFERHTKVVGWPEPSNPDERKQQRKLICLELSQDLSVKLIIPDSPIIRSA